MPGTIDVDASTVPQALEDITGVTVGTEYTIENVSAPGATAFVRSAPAAPAVTDKAHRLETGGRAIVTPDSTDRTWLWTDDPSGCALVMTPAAI